MFMKDAIAGKNKIKSIQQHQMESLLARIIHKTVVYVGVFILAVMMWWA